MEDLTRLTETLNSIRDSALDIAKNIIPLMKELKVVDNELIYEVIEDAQHQDLNLPEVATEIMQKIALKMTGDAETILSEIDAFAKDLRKRENLISENEEKYPFFAEVWCGDAYDSKGIEALEVLRDDIGTQASNANESGLVALAKIELEVILGANN